MWSRGPQRPVTLPATTVEEENAIREDGSIRRVRPDPEYALVDRVLASLGRGRKRRRVVVRTPDGRQLELAPHQPIKRGWVVVSDADAIDRDDREMLVRAPDGLVVQLPRDSSLKPGWSRVEEDHGHDAPASNHPDNESLTMVWNSLSREELEQLLTATIDEFERAELAKILRKRRLMNLFES